MKTETDYSIPSMEQLSQNVWLLTFPEGKKLRLIGTAHVSADSVNLVESVIKENMPDTVTVELDEQRYKAVKEKDRYRNLDIAEIIKKKQLFFFIGQFILASYQKKISEKTGSKPGLEFIRAIELAEESGAKLVLADRNIGVTLKRAFRLTRFRDKIRFLAGIFSSGDDEIDAVDIEKLKTGDALESMIKGFEKELPETKRVLIDERDEYLFSEIRSSMGENTVAVVGAGHVPGILRFMQNPVPSRKEELNVIPPKSAAGKILPWIIPAAVTAVIAWGFLHGNTKAASDAVIYWILVNGILAALGCLTALAHPLTTAAGFIAAPITSLNPTIGVGFVTALVQTVMVKPRVRDFEEISDHSLTVRGWWSNRLTRIFLVFLFSSIGSSIGTFVALPALMKIFQ